MAQIPGRLSLDDNPHSKSQFACGCCLQLSRSLLRFNNVSVYVPRLKSVAEARASACPPGSALRGKSSVGGLSKGVVCILPGPASSFNHFAVGI